jgi:hypothetical protein
LNAEVGFVSNVSNENSLKKSDKTKNNLTDNETQTDDISLQIIRDSVLLDIRITNSQPISKSEISNRNISSLKQFKSLPNNPEIEKQKQEEKVFSERDSEKETFYGTDLILENNKKKRLNISCFSLKMFAFIVILFATGLNYYLFNYDCQNQCAKQYLFWNIA